MHAFPTSYVLQVSEAGGLKQQAAYTTRGGAGHQLQAEGGRGAADSGVEPDPGEDEREGGPVGGEHAGGEARTAES